MADELEDVTQTIRADMAPYIEEFKKGEQETRRFADENRIADTTIKELIQATKQNTAALRDMREAVMADHDAIRTMKDATQDAADTTIQFGIDMSKSAEILDHARNAAIEDGRALADLAHEEHRVKDEAALLRDSAIEAGEALGHVRDEALEAAAAEHELASQAKHASEQLDLMGLSGISTFARLGPLLGLIGGLVVVGAGVAPAFVAAAAGLGAFTVLALPALSAVSSGYQTIAADQQAVSAATTAAAKNTALAKLQHDWAGMSAPIAATVKQVMAFKNEFSSLSQKSGIQSAALGDITKILNILRTLLPEIVPLAQQGAKAVGMLLNSFGSSIQSGGFLGFLHMLTALVVPATAAISRFSGILMNVLGTALEALAPTAVPFINLLGSLIKVLQGPLVAALDVVVNLILALAGAITPLLPPLGALATKLIVDIGKGFQAFIPILTQVVGLLGTDLLQILNDLEPILANFLTPNSPFMAALNMLPSLLRAILPLFTWLAQILSHPIFAQLIVDVISFLIVAKQVIAVLGLVSKAFGLLGLAFEATPVGWIVTAIAGLVFAFVMLWNHCAAFRNFWLGLWRDIQAIAAPIVSWIKNVLSDMSRWWTDHGHTVMAIVRTYWDFIKTVFKIYLDAIVAGVKVAFAIMEGVIKAVWDAIRIITQTVWNVIKTIITTIVRIIQDEIDIVLDVIHGHWSAAWGKMQDIAHTELSAIVSIIKTIGSGFINLLFQAGKDLIQGLMNGIKSMWDSAVGMVKDLGGGISGVFKSALSIFSPSREFFSHGLNIMLGLVGGIQAGRMFVKNAMNGVAGMIGAQRLPAPGTAYGVVGTPSPAASQTAYAGGASNGTINIYVDGYRLFTFMQSQLYRYNVRNSGQITGILRPGIA